MNTGMRHILPILGMASMFAESGDFIGTPNLKKPYIKEKRKCLLKSCENLTKHNGGYCCAEHAKEDRNVSKN